MPKHMNNKEKPQNPEAMQFRTIPLTLREDGAPKSLNEEQRSVECVAASETAVRELDFDRWEFIDTVLLMSGCQLPESRQLPLLDSHSRYDTSTVVGSARDLRIENDQLISRAVFTSLPEGDNPYTKVKEGHLTDFSIGRKDIEGVYIPEGETGMVEGRSFEGPIRVITKWIPKELSICPIGADETAKTRSAQDDPGAHNNTEGGRSAAEKEPQMDKKLRAFLVKRGLAEDATDQQAWDYLENLDVPTRAETEHQPQEEQDVVSAVRAEQVRIMEIQQTCRHYGYDDLAEELIKEGKDLDQCRAAILKKNMEEGPTTGGIGHRTEVVADERDKFRSAAQDALLIRSGFAPEKPAAGAEDLAGYSLRELARESLRMSNLSTGGNPIEMVGRALTTDDFPALLSNVANKSLFEGYNTADETWGQWCATGQVSDFKTNTIARLGEMDDLDEIGENDEYKYGNREDGKEQFQIATYGKLFSISRQTIINDDLGALTDIPRAHGEAWARKVGDIVYAVLIANAAMGDGIALFHADHGNIGTTGVINETTMAEAIKLMKMQKDISGKRRLNIRPQYLLAPVAQEGSAEVFFGSNQFAGSDTAATRTNPYAGSKYQRIYDPRLDDNDSDAWYLAGPKGKTVKVFFLNGNQLPYLETRQGWSVDGVEYKVRGDAGAKAVDWKAMVYNAGA
jgi:phage major head subunit gpT-like protein